ncbi:tRNA U34 5-methylaminomethyl-2-thiouridine-forming methyltransferase MnmC [Kordia periserrulae]|uniref:tRNA U34 5-methylaminomethyl-2-thiouridine-forming methyltransferase MnmC n=1 Tax=Kordia periserrulae TaxID=701523 RepID=A0A2T6BTX3_9FLAO|nr:tRNA (5-methylaminomethyl-2-thiouridine)(34)-methyltransferase MnmD [Kordia periserrulae]PTX59535.1 tRNA U34 5-methylaminomethyl-2-thiouridine-forming methyltransferase MnmC [Kordia periserrulae]
MKRKIITTKDGSTTIHLEEWNEQYHSTHGAIQEAAHVFINTGLHHLQNTFNPAQIHILEMGFGTGLNAFMTFLEAEKHNFSINYVGVEAYPVASAELSQLNYIRELQAENHAETFHNMHSCDWEKLVQLSENFKLTKRQQFFEQIDDKEAFNLIYFDAFGARVQPELWTATIFQKMYNALKNNGVLVTYAAKGSVRRAMQEVGFKVERLPGPPGKREMLRATKQ